MTELWSAVAGHAMDWLGRRQLAARDAVLLLPYAALLPPARAAFAALGGWQPRIETPLTLAAALGPPVLAAIGACSGDATTDHLNATLLLRRLPLGADWSRRDPAGFARIVGELVQAAQALLQGALLQPPAARSAYWAAVRELLPAGAGPAAMEALLLRVALEWAATPSPRASDRLFAHQPSAWLVLRLGGVEAQAEAVLGQGHPPGLLLCADPPSDDPYAEVAATAQVERLHCDDFEAESQAAAGVVLDALNAGRHPVALVALDREVVRRVRALLARAAVPLVDETGWLLATTPPAATLMALLNAALPQAGDDALLEWLKAWPPAPPRALNALEATLRGRLHVPGLDQAERLQVDAQALLQGLRQPPRRSLADWLVAVRDCLEVGRLFDRWLEDPAGEQVLTALGWPEGAAWWPAAADLELDLPGLIAWVRSTLEQQPFLPLPDPGAQVVLTPLSRAHGRAFAQVIVPGADALRLGAADPPATLLPDALASRLGLPCVASRREQQRLALAQVLRCGRVTLLRRLRDGEEPLADSPDVEWLLQARAALQPPRPPWPRQAWAPPTRQVDRSVLPRPLPRAAAALPTTLSASRLEALRDCPYRFYSRAVLRLDESEELDSGLAKRDYGTWLHAVLHHFHSQRQRDLADAPQLQAAAETVTVELGMDRGELLPFRASFDALAPAYLAWTSAREAAGWHWQSGETDQQAPLMDGDEVLLLLKGRLDRIDQGPGEAVEVLDYKTSSPAALKDRVKDPQEDTQLAFYAALLGAPTTLSAAYLALDDAQAPLHIPHPDVATTAAELLVQLRSEWRRLQQGAPLPALGEGRVCETCEARGLCRRDHWAAA